VELSNFPDAIDYAQNILSAVVFTGILAAFLGFANEALNQKDNKKEDDNGSDNQNFNGKVYINIFLYLTVTALFLTVLPNLLYTIIELLPYDSSAELADKYYYLRGFDPSDAYGNKNLFLSNQLNNTSVIMGVVGLFTSYFKSQ
jgi:magnesium-transporting ATPase (P-type)